MISKIANKDILLEETQQENEGLASQVFLLTQMLQQQVNYQQFINTDSNIMSTQEAQQQEKKSDQQQQVESDNVIDSNVSSPMLQIDDD